MYFEGIFYTAMPLGLLRSLSCFFLSSSFVQEALDVCIYLFDLPLALAAFAWIHSSQHSHVPREKCRLPHKSTLHFSPIARCLSILIPPCFAHGWFNPTQVYTSTRFPLIFCSPCGSCLRLVAAFT